MPEDSPSLVKLRYPISRRIAPFYDASKQPIIPGFLTAMQDPPAQRFH
jgi:hypothetical protein